MDITEIVTHTSMRIMSKIGEKLRESMCFRGWGSEEKDGHEDTPIIAPNPTPPGVEERQRVQVETNELTGTPPSKEKHADKNGPPSNSEPDQGGIRDEADRYTREETKHNALNSKDGNY